MGPDTGIMNTVLQTFLTKISIGVGVVGADARGLLGILATMELLLVALWWAYSGNEALSRLLRKVLTIFFFIWVIDNYSYILTWITDGFVWTGEKAAGGAAVDINDPSGILWAGLQVAKPILEHAKAQASFFGSFFDGLVSLLSAFIICFAYFILAFQIFLTRIEFALISTLGLILVPFGVFKYTAFMAEKVFGAVISFGVKLMVLAFVVSVGFPLMQTLSLPPDPSWVEMLSVMFGSLAMALLSIHAPGVASGLLNGGPSLTAGSAAGAGVAIGAAGATTLLGAAGATAVAKGAAGTGVEAVKLTATAANGAGRAAVDGSKAFASGGVSMAKGAMSAAGSGAALYQAGPLNGTRRVVSGVVGDQAGKAKSFYDKKMEQVQKTRKAMKDNLASSYEAGKDRINQYLEPRKEAEKGSDAAEESRSSEKSDAFDAEKGRGRKGNTDSESTDREGNNSQKSSNSKGRGLSRTAYAAQTAANATHSSQPSGGTHVKVRDERDD